MKLDEVKKIYVVVRQSLDSRNHINVDVLRSYVDPNEAKHSFRGIKTQRNGRNPLSKGLYSLLVKDLETKDDYIVLNEFKVEE